MAFGRFGSYNPHQVVPNLFAVVFLDDADLDVVGSCPMDAGMGDVAPHPVAHDVAVDEGFGRSSLSPTGNHVPSGVAQVGPADRSNAAIIQSRRIRTRDCRVKKRSFLPDYSILPDTFLEHSVQRG